MTDPLHEHIQSTDRNVLYRSTQQHFVDLVADLRTAAANPLSDAAGLELQQIAMVVQQAQSRALKLMRE